jgi:formylglycine-generating enzyme required for sulfatase activity
MGVVWLAHDPDLDRDVALKILPAEYCQDEERLKRFIREAQLAAKLLHTNTVTIHDVGVSEGEAFIAMELVEGASLDAVVQQGGRLPWREATQAIRDAAAGLAAAHARGLIHRDVKPANLMRTKEGVTKVVDFGLARALASNSQLTQQAARLGTPAYMAPEQWVGKAVDGRSDLYALTCSYYHLLTGRVPFEAPEIAALGYQHRHQPFPEAKEYVPDLPEAVCRILKRGSQKDPAARYQTGEEMIADLDAALGEVGSRVASPAWQTLSRWQGMAGDFLAAGMAAAKEFLVRRPIVLAGVLGLVVLLGVVFYLSTNYGWVKIEVEAVAGQVEVKVDGDTIDVAGLNEPIRLRAGEHNLLVEAGEYRTYTKSFSVRRESDEVLRVALEPKPKAPQPSDRRVASGPNEPASPEPVKPEPPRPEPEPVKPEPPRPEPEPVKPEPPKPQVPLSTPSNPKEYTNSIGMKFALIPAGTFLMGSPENDLGRSPIFGYNESPQHEVEITRPFYLGIHPVTQKQWQHVMGSNPSWFSSTGRGKDKVQGLDTSDFPVESVSWEDCQEFIRKMSELSEEKRSERVYRLPTEAEWEYSCRGGASSYQVYAFGNSLTTHQANFNRALWRTCKVGSYQPNGFGLYDMHGNVCQWCADWYNKNYYRNSPQQNPQGPPQSFFRVIRGGSWRGGPQDCRSAARGWLDPRGSFDALGCRLVLVPFGQAR